MERHDYIFQIFSTRYLLHFRHFQLHVSQFGPIKLKNKVKYNYRQGTELTSARSLVCLLIIRK